MVHRAKVCLTVCGILDLMKHNSLCICKSGCSFRFSPLFRHMVNVAESQIDVLLPSCAEMLQPFFFFFNHQSVFLINCHLVMGRGKEKCFNQPFNKVSYLFGLHTFFGGGRQLNSESFMFPMLYIKFSLHKLLRWFLSLDWTLTDTSSLSSEFCRKEK